MSFFIDFPYDVHPSNVIGRYIGHDGMGANTGIIGSGYMQMGLFGIFIYTLITVVFFNKINNFNSLPLWVINSLVLMPILTLFISSDALTSILTHGLFTAFLALFFLSQSTNK